MTFDEKTLHVAIAISALELVRSEEEEINPKSARSRSLQNLIDNAARVIGYYKMNDWSADNLDKAAQCFDFFGKKVDQMFNSRPPTRVVRGSNGRFQRVEG